MADLREPPSRATIFCNATEILDGCSPDAFITELQEPENLGFLGSVLDSSECGLLRDQVNTLMESDGDFAFSQLFLKTKVEHEVQRATHKHLSSEYPDLLVKDTSDSDNSPMCASLPSSTEKHGLHHLWNNRIDFASPLFPCGLELKDPTTIGKNPHLDGLQQGLKRIQVLTQRAAHLKRVIIFVLAPFACTMIIAESSFEETFLEWKIHMVSIPVSHLLPLWRILHQYAKEYPLWFLHPQASCLRRVVQALWSPSVPIEQRDSRKPRPPPFRKPSPVLPLCYFSIQFVADCSSSTVYLINGSTADLGKRRMRLFRHGPQTFAVKVFKKRSEYLNEVVCLHQMAKRLIDKDAESLPEWDNPSRFYPLAHFDFG
jgi:hypothetical protein